MKNDTLDLIDWGLTEDPEVQQVARKAATSIAYAYATTIEYDDAYQEALYLIAVMPGAAELVPDQLGALYHRVRLDLMDLVRRETDKRKQHVSWEIVTEGAE